ncbi:LysR family transcriptional regulator [Poseidonocella sedimentorum]|uniref:DNA-binding transcriptional regulator, LysR family n=1 Tax=Poseidonocella sedimentorum TaxID=871652 RepID=A0A1I6ELI5_9RHOB|nr:LysR family transcriptional regulator [Poseidonocella sedimentorum]SFR18555.1 DNA-binding transcriptional regulator, LysR family [Poseidonocella sedimentorum]
MKLARNIRHFRVVLAVAESGSLTRAAALCNISQPAVSQALHNLEGQSGGDLFARTRRGVFPTERGELLCHRLRRALAHLDPGLDAVSPRLKPTLTHAQLQALAAVVEAENFSLAAKRLNLAQPTVHRAVAQVERAAGRELFLRAAHGLVPTPQARTLARALRLFGSELEQAEAELSTFDGREAGRIAIGALPLSRSVLLPQALTELRKSHPRLPIEINDGPYEDLLPGLLRGDLDFIVGALRVPAPIAEVVQEPLFTDALAFVARPNHPLVGRPLRLDALTGCQWVVPRPGSPSRGQFDAYFASRAIAPPESLIECGSILFMRELLHAGEFIGCISETQAEAEIAKGMLARLDVAGDWPGRAIGLTVRKDWEPTPEQALLLDLLRNAAEARARGTSAP